MAARAATTGDLPALAALLSACASAVCSERGGRLYVRRELVRPPYGDVLSMLLGDPRVLVAAGTIDDQLLGLAISRIETLSDGGLLGRLELLFVEPEAREVGVGEALVREAIAWAAQHGAAALDAYALPGSRETKNFLESSGFVARLIVMSLDLSAPPLP